MYICQTNNWVLNTENLKQIDSKIYKCHLCVAVLINVNFQSLLKCCAQPPSAFQWEARSAVGESPKQS